MENRGLVKKTAYVFVSFLLGVFFFMPAKSAEASVVMSLDPATATVAKDDNQEIKVMLDSGTQELTAGEYYLEFDPAKIEFVSAYTDIDGNSSYAGPGQSYNYGGGTCTFRPEGGRMQSGSIRYNFMCTSSGEFQTFKGSIHAASLTFKALVDSGTADITFVFIGGETARTSTAINTGVNYLTGVEDGAYTLSAASESHKECASGSCVDATGAGDDQCTTDAECAETHKACVGEQCEDVAGAGDDTCETSSDCTSEDSYLDCVNSQCVRIAGSGSDDSECVGKSAGDSCSRGSGDDGMHLECKNNACVAVAGERSDESACSGKYAGNYCSTGSSSSSTTTTTTTATTTKGGTTSGVPATAGSGLMTVLTGLGVIGLTIFAALVL